MRKQARSAKGKQTIMGVCDNETSYIAIVGMSGRFPGAATIAEFWRNLCAGREALRAYSCEEVNAAVAAHDYATVPYLTEQVRASSWVAAGFVLDDIDKFDASFFGYTPAEAELLDPQQRLFLETAWAAIEDAGYVADCYPGRVGIFAGAALSRYFFNNIYSNREILYSSRDLTAGIGNEPDYLTNRVAYKLNLTGPAITVQTACSSSLVAIHLAGQSLLAGESDMCLAGGVMVAVPASGGYLYQEGSMLSPDGHIRAFDAEARGTVFSEGGVGVICLKRLEDAVADKDHIYAVIRGSAVNNDGFDKAGYTAPGIDGQAQVITQALAVSGVSPEDITYVEAHGTGTPLGDPIEVAALTRAYRAHTARSGYCAIGSVKPNVGHLAPAAGVASVIKTALAVKHGVIPPSINFSRPNPRIDFANSPFFVNQQLRPWEAAPRRIAAVSSFGIGGTNAHLILEQPPEREAPLSARARRTYVLSARSVKALQQVAEQLDHALAEAPETDLADLASTLRYGRKPFDYRAALVADSIAELRARLHTLAAGAPARKVLHAEHKLAWMFSGQGSQYIQMGRGLYEAFPVFRATLDRCFQTLSPGLGIDLHALLCPNNGVAIDTLSEQLRQTRIAQPVLFAFASALAEQLREFGIEPQAMIGHSLGEYVAASLAGVFTLEDALRLVALRGHLMQSMPTGSMLAVSMEESALSPYLGDGVCLAAVNAPASCVLSGPTGNIKKIQEHLEREDIACRLLVTSHAFHSTMMVPILSEFRAAVRAAKPQPPTQSFVSNVTGDWITADQAQDPEYWGAHLLKPVRFHAGLQTLFGAGFHDFLEVGPGNALTSFTRRSARSSQLDVVALQLTPQAKEAREDEHVFRQALGDLWSAGYALDWRRIEPDAAGQRISLPTYPFARDRHWVEARKVGEHGAGAPGGKRQNIDEWFYVPSWKRQSRFLAATHIASQSWREKTVLVLAEPHAITQELLRGLEAQKATVIHVSAGEEFAQRGANQFVIAADKPEHYERLLSNIHASAPIAAVIHAWSLTPDTQLSVANCPNFLTRSFYSLLYLTQALCSAGNQERIALLTVSSEVCDVYPTDHLNPAKATALGVHLCVGFENKRINSRNIDFPPSVFSAGAAAQTARQVLAELALLLAEPTTLTTPSEKLVAHRDGYRWLTHYESMPLRAPTEPLQLRAGGTYLITGGLGGLGLECAESLAAHGAGRILLLSRSAFPPSATWNGWLAEKGLEDEVSRKITKLRAIERAGAEAVVLQADVTEAEQLREFIAMGQRQWGPIHGVIHAAGVAGGGLLQLKSRQMAEQVLLPKVCGALALQEALADQPLDFFLLFSSLFAVAGGIGQVDYSAANNFLDAFAREQTRRGAWNTMSINWGAWSEVGMAARSGLFGAVAKTAPSMPDGKQYPHPFLFGCTDNSPEQATFTGFLRVQDHWALQEHEINGTPVMPGTALLEMVRAAFSIYSGASQIVFEHVYFYRPVMVPQDIVCEVRVQFTLARNGLYTFDCLANQPDGMVMVMSGAIAPLTSLPEQVNLDHLRAGCTLATLEFSADQPQVLQGADELLRLGPHWQVLQQMALGQDCLLGVLTLPDSLASDLGSFVLHPSLLDMATGPITGHLLRQCAQDLEGEFLPFSYGRLQQKGSIPATLYTYIRYRGAGERKDTLSFDITLYDPTGTEVVTIQDFVLKQLPKAMRTARPGRGPAAAAIDYLDDSVSPREGKEVFERLLSLGVGQPQWIVSPPDLPGLLAQMKAKVLAAAQETAGKRTRVARADVEATPPTNRIQELLVGVFETVMGLEPIGIHDNFFDLGGDSIMAIQIVAHAKAHGLAIKPHELFEHQTVAELSTVIESENGAALTEHCIEPAPVVTVAARSDGQEDGGVPTVDILAAELSTEDVTTLLNALAAQGK